MRNDPQAPLLRAEVGNRLRGIRRNSGLTQSQLSRAASIGQASLSNYENGKRDLPLATVVRLSGALGITIGDLLEVPAIMVIRDAGMGQAVRLLAQSPELLDSIVGPVQKADAEEQDAAAQEPDAGAEEQDAAAQEPGAGPEEQDAAAQEPDAGAEEQDAAAQEQDAGTEEQDAGTQE